MADNEHPSPASSPVPLLEHPVMWDHRCELQLARPPHHLEAPDSGLVDHLRLPLLLASLDPLLLLWVMVLWFTSSSS
jgi:hypothetical protein